MTLLSFFRVDALTFPNQPCRPRPTVVEIPQPNSVRKIHYPYYVMVHRCGGGCGAMQFLSKCQPKGTSLCDFTERVKLKLYLNGTADRC